MLRRLARLLPDALIKYVARLQYRVPLLHAAINAGAQYVTRGTQTIQRGVGAGLLFDHGGSNPGYIFGTTEPDEQQLMADLIAPGDVVYNLGANVGFHAVLAARLAGPTGRVVAVEPFPASAEQVRLNARLNGFDQITVVEVAVSDQAGTADLALHDESTHHALTEHNTTEGITQFFTVETATVDALVEEHGPPDVLLIDVEAAEEAALRGGLRTLAAHRPVVSCEVHWLGAPFARFVREEIEPLGYRARTFDGAVLPEEPVRYHALFFPEPTAGS